MAYCTAKRSNPISNMTLTKEQLEEIQHWAEVFYQPDQVAIIMFLNKAEFLQEYANKESEVCLAFKRGYLKSEGEIRKSIFEQAKAGSGPAQTLAWKLIQESKY